MSTPTTQAGATSADETVTILYTNWRGETAVRRITPIAREWFGSSDWHPEPQWLFTAFDMEKEAFRDFARSGVKAWGKDAVDAAIASPAVVPESVRSLKQQRDMALEALHTLGVRLGVLDPSVASDGPQLLAAMSAYRDHLADAPPSGRAAEGGEASAALARLKARDGEDEGEWASRLAADLVRAGEIESAPAAPEPAAGGEWSEHSVQEIVRRTRCMASETRDAVLWRDCCDLILERIGATPTRADAGAEGRRA